jgi:hypothetical protein
MKRLLLLTGCVSTLAAQSWYDAAWAYRKAVVLDHRYVPAAQIGYVATIFVPNSYQASTAGDADIAGNIRSDCRDVVFTGADGKTPVEYQIIPGTCDSTAGRFAAKVRVASLSASDDTVLMMYFGNPSAPDQPGTGVWDANYKGVWYGDSLKDATGNHNDLTVSSGTLATVPGRIATAFQFLNPAAQLTTGATVPGSASFSLSAWIRGEWSPQKQMASGYSQPVTVGNNAYEFTWDAVSGAGADARFGNVSPLFSNPSRTLLGKQFYLFAMTCASGTFSIYLDGSLRSSGTVPNCNVGNQVLRIGGGATAFFEGRVDEVEYSTAARSKEYWYTKWLNEAHPEYFVTFGSRQRNTPAAPSVDLFTASYTAVEAGQSVVLRWIVSGSPATVTIDQGSGPQSNPMAGSLPVRIDATTTFLLTAANASGSSTRTLTISVLTAPFTYARSGPPAGSYIMGFTANPGESVQMTVGDPLPILPGDYVVQRGLASNNAADGYFSNLNGVFKVKQVIDSTHYTIVDKNGNEITPNGAYNKGIWNPFNDAAIKYTPNGAAWAGKATPYRFVTGPRGTLDGTNGVRSRTIALGTQNGLTSLVVSGNVATVTTSFDPALLNISSGVQVAVWGTTNSALNNGNANAADYTVTSVSANGYQFAVLGVPNGNYTHNDRCGPSPGNPNVIGGTENCVRISVFATKSNVEFQQIRAQVPTGPSSYQYVFDGGTVPAGGPSGGVAFAAEVFAADQANQSYVDAMVYCLTHLERLSGVNFVVDEWSPNNPAGNVMADINSTHETGADIAEIYQAGSRYLTDAQKRDATAKILNHRAVSNADCRKVVPQPVILATGSAQGGSSNTIILAANETKDFTNNYVYRNNGTDIYFALISSYNTATKTATVSTIYNYGIIHVSSRPNLNPTMWTPPSAGEAYTVYATVTLSGTTVTGYNTTFTKYSTGDGIFAMIGDINTIYQVLPPPIPDMIDYVSAVHSDTSLTIIKGFRNETMSGTPKMLMYVPKWKTGDCGLADLMLYGWGFGSQPVQRPPNGGYLTVMSDGQTPSWGSNNKPIQARAYMVMAAAMADDDPVQAADIYGLGQNWWFDYELPFQWMFWTPVLNEGPNYSFGNSMMKGWYPLLLFQVLDGFPMPPVSSTYWTNYGLLKMYYPKPDKASGIMWNTSWGGDGSDNALSRVSAGSAHLMIADQGFVWQPFATSSAYLRNWTAANLDNGYWGSVGATRWMYYNLDPRIPNSDYTVQPRQYFFSNVDRAGCSLTTGLDCGYLGQADTVISRTGWTDRQASLVTFHGRPYTGAYDCPQMGDLWLYKTGWLLGNDYAGSAGQCGPYSTSTGLTSWESGFEFNGANTVTATNGLGLTLVASAIRRWYSGNRGSWSRFYGDQASKVAYAMVDFAGAYRPTYNRVWRHMAHFKSGAEVLVQFDDVDTSNQPAAAGIRSQVHFPQNGEGATTNNGTLVEYAEGSTVCQNCTGTNPAGYVWERESGAPADSSGPARTNGLIASFFSPRDITLRWDGHGYSGARGHTERLSICAGTSCGAAATTLEAVHVYEVQTSIGPATPTATALNPDANWTGVRTADKAVLFGRGGQLRSAVPEFSVPAGQVLIAGLAAGRYDVSVGGTQVVTGAIVGDGDNALYFDSPAGTVTVARTDLVVCSIPAQSLPGAAVGTIYSGALATANCTAPVAWSVTGGALCAGLSLDPASGQISGVPVTAGTCNFSLQATDGQGDTAATGMSIVVAAPAAALSGGVKIVR